MLLDPAPDLELLRDTTAKFLAERVPPDEIRRRRDDPAGFDPAQWSEGATLGWTSLLVAEAHGGGTVSGRGLVDLSAVAYEFGRHAAPGPLVPTNVVAHALSRAGTHTDVIGGLLAGTTIGTWCLGEAAPHQRLGDVALSITESDDDLVLDGCKRPVESATQADVFLVTGRHDGAVASVLVPADTPGVRVEPMHGVDLTRRFAIVHFDGARVPATERVDADVARLLQVACVITAAEAVGAMQRVFDITVAWAFERYSFGRPLASYQALKHRFADMFAWLQAAHGIADAAAHAVDAGTPDAAELVSAALAFIGEFGAELAHDCVQLHGGIGVTFEHDLHLYLRRITLDRTLWGTPSEHRRRLADLVDHAPTTGAAA